MSPVIVAVTAPLPHQGYPDTSESCPQGPTVRSGRWCSRDGLSLHKGGPADAG
jgi:hypothetical protein